MSVNVETKIVEPGDDAYVEEAWELKERIRRRENVLHQRRSFFVDAYVQSRSHLIFAGPYANELAGFATTRQDGYILFLAVAPEHRGEGFGRELVGAVANEHRTVTCHARTSNETALDFYEHLGFEIVRRIDTYYEDGAPAYYLRLGDDAGLTTRLFEFFRR